MSAPPTTYVALMSIGHAIRDLSKPRAGLTTTNEFGSSTEDIYATGPAPKDSWGKPPHLWPEMIDVTEALIGSALVVAQAYIVTTRKKSKETDDINHVANYWKHRGDWGPPWGSGPGAPHAPTLAAVQRLGAAPPLARGQLQDLIETVLGRPFDVNALWHAIS
jgi:hypothetical protein